MVKKLFPFIFTFIFINLLGLLNVNAITIAVFDTNYDVVGYCNNCTEVYPSDGPHAYANRVVVTYDGISITSQLNYEVDLGFNIYTANNIQFLNKTLYVLGNEHYYQNATQELRITNVSDVIFPEVGTGKNSAVSYHASFTSTANGSVRLDIEFSRQLWSYFRINNALVTYKGQNNNESINTSTQNIIINNNSNTNKIIQDNQENTQDIINNQNSNTQDIINNQNSNTEEQIESQKVCSTQIINNSLITSSGYLNGAGDISPTPDGRGVTDYIYVNKATNFKNLLTSNTGASNYLCFYGENKEFVSCVPSSSYNNNNNIIVPSNAFYVRFTIISGSNRPQFSFDVCKNGNQALNDSVNDLNDTLNNELSPDTEGYLEDFSENVASDTPITDLITMPLTLINAYINGMNSSCTSYNFGSLLGTNLIMPCINLQQRLGSNIWSIIDVLFSIFMIFNISKLFISAFNNFTSLKDDFSNMYTNDYQPKHGGDE